MDDFCVSGTEAETKEFMAVCVQTAARYPLNDMISPVFIFERLCSIIYPVSTSLISFENSSSVCCFFSEETSVTH